MIFDLDFLLIINGTGDKSLNKQEAINEWLTVLSRHMNFLMFHLLMVHVNEYPKQTPIAFTVILPYRCTHPLKKKKEIRKKKDKAQILKNTRNR